MTDFGFIRVSTGSQDAKTQRRDILKASPDAIIVTPDTKAASASKGEQMDALDAVIAKLGKGDRVIVTDTSRLDRRDNLTSQIETVIDIRRTGAVILSLDPKEAGFSMGDDLGSWINTIVKQNGNAEKSRVVKTMTWRGISDVMANKGMHGALPAFWKTKGARYSKQAYCANPEAVRDIYERVAAQESLSSAGRRHNLYPQSVKALINFAANHTGVIVCSYTHDGETETWPHAVKPVVDSGLWWRANKAMEATSRGNKGGRPVAQVSGWISGVLDCPACGGKLYLNASPPRKGARARTPKIRCQGAPRQHVTCGDFKGIDAAPIISALGQRFATDTSPVLAYQRIAGNQHELDALEAELAKLQGSLGTVTDRAERREAVARIEALEDEIDGFKVIPDTFDYSPTGQTIAQMWEASDDAGKRAMIQAVKASGAVHLIERDGEWGVRVRTGLPGKQGDVIDLGGGICFRRTQPDVIAGLVESE